MPAFVLAALRLLNPLVLPLLLLPLLLLPLLLLPLLALSNLVLLVPARSLARSGQSGKLSLWTQRPLQTVQTA